jgi:pimeloyl-ACP methyl ester carboxylesterase
VSAPSVEQPSTVRVPGPDGVEVAVHRWGTPGNDPPVVLQHGFAADSMLNWQFTGIVPALVAAGREVVAVDARAHGQSDKPHDPASYGELAMAADLVAVADALELAEYDLAGHSMGGVIALVAALEAGNPATITAPTLVLAGDDDPRAVRPEVLAGAVPGATLTPVPGNHLECGRRPAVRHRAGRVPGCRLVMCRLQALGG